MRRRPCGCLRAEDAPARATGRRRAGAPTVSVIAPLCLPGAARAGDGLPVMPLLVGAAILVTLVVVGVLLRRRWVRLGREETLFWARRGGRDGVEALRATLKDAGAVTSDPVLGPMLAARLADREARLAALEQRYDAMPDGLAEELRALEQDCKRLCAAITDTKALREAAAWPRATVTRLETHAVAEPPTSKPARSKAPHEPAEAPLPALRQRLDRLEQQRLALEAGLHADPPPPALPEQAQALGRQYFALNVESAAWWRRLHPAEAQADMERAGDVLGDLLDFQRRFRDEQERDLAAQREFDERERRRRGDDDTLIDRLL